MEPFRDNTPELWSRLIDINLRGPIHCCRAVMDDMMTRNSGKIISISSDAARVGSSGEAVYSACKGGIISFSKTLARELARHRVTVNVICPGPTDTPLLRGMVEAGNEKLVDRTDARHSVRTPGCARGDRRRGRVLCVVRRRLHHRPGAERQRRIDDGRMIPPNINSWRTK